MERRAYLVRHGAVENPGDILYGRLPGFPLSTLGRSQARAAGEKLSSLLGAPGARVIASPLERAQQTAAIVAEVVGGEVSIDERLIEADTCFEGLPKKFLPARYLSRYFDPSWNGRNEKPGIIAARMMQVVREALDERREVILVSHQFPIQMTRAGFATQIDKNPSWIAQHVPWPLVSVRCSLASITSLHFSEDLREPRIEYWER